VISLTVTRTSCSGVSGGPVKSSVDSAEFTRIPAPYDRGGRRGMCGTRVTGLEQNRKER
jgi:hypothetical protein